MKPYFFLVFIVFFLIQFSCDKDIIEDKHPEWSKVTALKNKIAWESEAVAFIEISETKTLLSIPANVHNEDGFWREGLSFGNIDLLIGKHIILGSLTDTLYARYTTLMADGDVVEDRFIVCEDVENFIDIQTLDTIEMKLSGNFKVTFIRDINDPITNPSLPDTIRFTEGSFSLKMISSN
ncbi:MAG: hypothetical protein GY834_08075 [Bacteroidetes bacterium]|nr:hypothetical protein [Bacteroidota bacterium]